MTHLLLVRHGETIENVRQIMQGQTQGCLTEKGILQAEELARQLAGEPIDAFVSSDLKRSFDTCQIIARPHQKEIFTTPLLRERDWGDFTGEFIPDLKDRVWPENVESLEKLKERAAAFLRLMAEKYPNQTVLAVGHGIINKAIQAVYHNKPMHEIPRMANAEIRRLEIIYRGER